MGVRTGGTVAGLMRACHPVPALAVTVFAIGLALAADKPAGTCALVGIAVGCGQLSIGWSNDRIDRARDLLAERRDKPLVSGAVPLRLLDGALAAVVPATAAASLTLGWRAALVHLAAVAAGWAYNAGLKATLWSWLPYAVAFGLLPGVATFAIPAAERPAAWAVLAGALLGVGAHITNTLPDLVADRAAGVRGLPQRLGARTALVVAALTLLAGSVVLVLGPAEPASRLRLAGLALAVALTVTGTALAWRRPEQRATFYGTIGLAALDLVLLLGGPSFVS
jgi:4-hydroxybenzoate polyprenyltransferase